ncbi:MAG: YcxB-like protein [Pseudomonadota bacterium]
MIAICLFTGAYLLYTGEISFGLSMMLMAIILATLLAAARWIVPYWWYWREPKLRQEYHLDFDTDVIKFRTETVNSELQWSLYKRAVIGPEHYLLYYGNKSFTVIPRRAFSNVSSSSAFETLLREKLGSKMIEVRG